MHRHNTVGQYLSFFDFVEGRTQPLSVVHVVILPENETRSIERNFQIVTALQAQFQGSLSAGVYDGRKNFFSPVVLEIETGAQEVYQSSRSLIPDSKCCLFYSLSYLWALRSGFA